MCWRLRHLTSPPWLPSSTNTAGQPTTAGTWSLRERRARAETSNLDLPHHIRPDLPRLIRGEVPRETPSNSRLLASPLHAELTDEFQSWEGELDFAHSQRACRQASYIPARPVGNRVRVLSPGCSIRAPLPNAESGVGWRMLAHLRILRGWVAGRGAGVDPLTSLQNLRDLGRPG